MGKKKQKKKKAEQRRIRAVLRKIMAEQRKAASLERRALAAEQRRAAAEKRRIASEERRATALQRRSTAKKQKTAAEPPIAAKQAPANFSSTNFSSTKPVLTNLNSPGRDSKRGWFRRSARVQYPIGIKLVIITSSLLLVSLGAITVLVSYMVSRDLRITAEDTNFTVNRRSAAEADHAIQTIRSNALQLLDSLNSAADADQSGLQAALAEFYFERNEDVAALVIGSNAPLVNSRFFLVNEIDTDMIDHFMLTAAAQAERVPVLLNAAPVFGIPLLGMILPWDSAGGRRETITVIFSSDYITDSFGESVNTSYMINHDGDILVHADQDLVLAGANNSTDPLVMLLFESREPNHQTRYTDKAGIEYFGAFHKLSIADAAVITLAEYTVVFEGIAATTRRNIYLTAAVLFLAILFTWFFSRTISTPLKELTNAAEKIELGQFELTLAESGRDEVGFLSDAFVKMGNALVNFSRFTNVEVAMRAMRGELALGGNTKQATVLFTDIRSFTSMSEKMESVEVLDFLNDYMTRMVSCVNKTKGTVDKFMGDGIMAHWGAVSTTGSPASDALNAVLAALAMRAALRAFNAGRDGSAKQPRIRIGCGISSGPVVAGQIGSQERMEYTVIGDTVNLASRMEGLNKAVGTDILITEDTWKLVGGFFITEKMPMVQVKGKEKPVQIYAVINTRARNPAEQQRPLTLKEVRALMGIPVPHPPVIKVEVPVKGR
ncbi:adenylate/guanylate cyclase domain-containing protein [Spirochaetia bacterium]|nr:adenylate/guanylate cyclase domain-containing protein [Spirochaetia bacterium]